MRINSKSTTKLFSSTGLLMLLACTLATAAASPPEIWLCPHGEKVFDLLAEGSTWDFTRDNITGIKLYIGLFYNSDVEDLVPLAEFINQHGYQVTVECGGTANHDWQDQAGERSASVEMRGFKKWYAAGGKIDYLDLDGPVRRLLGHAGWGRDPAKKFTSVERCADELMDYMAGIKSTYPKIRFFLLTNFPNWGYKGGVSYHARGPQQQDWGEYDAVIKAVLAAAKKSGQKLAGATVDNPYEYLTGIHGSVKLEDPKSVDWIARVRAYEDFCRAQGLEFNLIINSEEGGKTSDELFFNRTLEMLALYQEAGGAPTRYIVQSWYDYPKTIVPESAPHSMTALIKEVIKRTR